MKPGGTRSQKRRDPARRPDGAATGLVLLLCLVLGACVSAQLVPAVALCALLRRRPRNFGGRRGRSQKQPD
jgi:hypothetical protein